MYRNHIFKVNLCLTDFKGAKALCYFYGPPASILCIKRNDCIILTIPSTKSVKSATGISIHLGHTPKA